MLKKQLFLFCIAGLLLCACGENTSGGASTTNDSTSNPKSASPSSKNEVRSTIKVTIKSGELAGTYEADCREGCTSYGIAGEKVFGNQYSEMGKGPKELSSVQLVVDNVTGDKQTKEFLMTISFGELFTSKGTSYNINTRNEKKDGSGSLDLKYSGSKATVKINGTTKEGIEVDVLIDAHKVITVDNLVEQ